MYKCTKFTLHKNLITPAYFLLYPGTVTLPFVQLPDPQSDVMQAVRYRVFCRLWLQQLLHIVIGKPCNDLCWTCQKNSMAIMKMANTSDCQKQKVLFIIHYTEDKKVANIHINFLDY